MLSHISVLKASPKIQGPQGRRRGHLSQHLKEMCVGEEQRKEHKHGYIEKTRLKDSVAP